MKKIIIALSLIISYQSSWGQCPTTPDSTPEVCEDGKGISTNPEAPINCEGADASGVPVPWRQNYFDWRILNPPASPQPVEYYEIHRPNGNTAPVMNPFTGPTDAEYYGNLTFTGNSNYQPEDGWELMKVEFGSPAGTLDEYFPKLPYMMLYNKYSGTLRFFGALMDPDETYRTVEVKMSIPKHSPGGGTNNYQNDLNATNLLSIQGESIQPLDQETSENTLSAFVEYTNNDQNFFWFDIPVAYDPCTCQFKSQFDVSFKWVQVADIEITGDLSGSIKTSTASGSSNSYPVKVFGKVLAAGVSTALAIKTGGAVVNVRAFAELVDIFKSNPNTSTSNKQKLTELQNVLNCTTDYVKVFKGNFEGLNGTDKKKKAQAGLKLTEGSIKYFSALENGCKKDKSATTITGRIKAEGTLTLTDKITGTRIELAVPGSKWDEDLGKRSGPSSDGKLLPAYPLYNERLGTFALLKTPDVTVLTQQISCDQHLEREPSLSWSMRLSSDIIYAFNPVLNLDLEKTLILTRIVIHKDAFVGNQYSYPERCKSFYPFNTNLNLEHFPDNEYVIVSPYMSIDYLKSLPLRFDWTSTVDPNINDYIFIQFKIVAESNNIGSDGENNSIFQILTFPVNIKETESDPNGQIASGNYIQESLNLNSNLVFNSDTTLYFEGPVYINANLSTTLGTSVTIYSINGFVIEDESNISPDIHLVARPHLEKDPQPEANFKDVSNFCSNEEAYKAKSFSPKAMEKIIAEDKDYLEQIRRDEEKEKSKKRESLEKETLKYDLFPNPTDGIVNLKTNSKSGIYKVIDVNGRAIKHGVLTSKETSIDISDVNSGVYFIQILNEENQVYFKKVIKN